MKCFIKNKLCYEIWLYLNTGAETSLPITKQHLLFFQELSRYAISQKKNWSRSRTLSNIQCITKAFAKRTEKHHSFLIIQNTLLFSFSFSFLETKQIFGTSATELLITKARWWQSRSHLWREFLVAT